VEVISRQVLTGVLIVGFGPDEQVEPLAYFLRHACRRVGLDVLEVLRAENGRYWSYLCDDPLCCPADGSPYDPGTSPVAAEWTMAGRVALPDREAYEKQLKPISAADRTGMREATARAGDRLLELITQPLDERAAAAAVLAAGDRAIDDALSRVHDGESLTDDEVAWLSVLVSSFDLQSTTLTRIRMSGDQLSVHRTLWTDVFRRAERDLITAPGNLCAFATWRCGEGALARLALERVLRVDPDDVVADAMYHMWTQGLPPSTFDDPRRPKVRRRPGRRPRKRSSSRRAGSRRG
jgi:hypothetical protein